MPIEARSSSSQPVEWKAQRRCQPRAARLRALLVGIALTSAVPAGAAKWHGCPEDPNPIHPSTLGATNAPFAHPGHELRIVLNQAQVAASGGFAVTPDGNRVEVTIESLYGSAFALQPRFATAASPSSLTFPFPDTAAEGGRLLAGPASVRVVRGDRVVAMIAAADLVALPPATDVTALLEGDEPNQVVYAALGASGDLWVPASFHGKEMPMPGCPGDVLMPLRVEIGAAEIPGLELHRRSGPLARLRRVLLYFGDFTMNGYDFYGALSPQRIQLRHLSGTRGVAICQMNDAIDLVLRVKGSSSWARSKRSPFRTVVHDAAPVPLLLRGAKPLPEQAAAPHATTDDTFGGTCEPAPVKEPHGPGSQGPSPQP